MGGEPVAHAASRERADDEHVFRGRVGPHGHLQGGVVQPGQGLGQGERGAGVFGPGRVGQVLAGAGDAHLDERGGQGRDDGHGQGGQGVAAALLVAAPAHAEDRGPLHHVGQHHDRRGEHGGHGLDEDVAVGDVAQLVADDALDLLGREQAQQALGDGDHGVLRVAAGGEGVGGLLGHEVEPGRGDARAGGHLGQHGVQGRGVLRGQGPGAVHGEDDLVRVPVAHEVHHQGEAEGDDEAGPAAHELAEKEDQAREQGEEEKGLQLTGHATTSGSFGTPAKDSQPGAGVKGGGK